MFQRLSSGFIIAVLISTMPASGQDSDRAIRSEVTMTEAGQRILAQTVHIDASIEDTWAAYTTNDGWMAWAAPQAEVDLRVGGTIRTAYQGEIGGSETNTLHIVNYVPYTLLTLRADLSQNWPEVMKQDADNLSNVILFEEAGPGRTIIRSYGIGYGDSLEYEGLMQFFIQANEGLFSGLKRFLEDGVPVNWTE